MTEAAQSQSRAETVAEERRQRDTVKSSSQDPTLNRFGIGADKLDFDKYVYRAALDDKNRLYELVDRGEYEFVTTNDGKVGKSLKSDAAGVVKYRAGTTVDGAPAYSYLLRKLKKFADEDRDKAVAEVDAREKLQMRGATKDAPDQSYTPKR